MAYTATVSKESVSKVNDKIYRITINMSVSDEAEEVFAASASEQYNNQSPDLAGVKNRLTEQLQEQWDKYADENNLFTAGAFDTMVNQIQTAANSYVNS